MTEEEIRKIINDTFDENIMNNLDSSIIFKYIEGLEKENQELKKQLEEKENQQKEFIEWLEGEIERSKISRTNVRGMIFRSQNECLYDKILLKYKEIIGGKDEKI